MYMEKIRNKEREQYSSANIERHSKKYTSLFDQKWVA